MIPITPTTTTQARSQPKRAPTSALATRSPMSTNPPMAVRTPSVTCRYSRTSAAQRRREAIQETGHPAQVRERVGEHDLVAAPRPDAQVSQEVHRLARHIERLAPNLVGPVA